MAGQEDGQWVARNASSAGQHPPQREPAPQRRASSSTVVAPEEMAASMVVSVTARQWQMYTQDPC